MERDFIRCRYPAVRRMTWARAGGEDAMSRLDELAPTTRLTFLLKYGIVLDVQLVTENPHGLIQQAL